MDALLAEQQLREAETARTAQHADADGWRSWWDRLALVLRGERRPSAGTESVASIRARKMKEREREQRRGVG